MVQNIILIAVLLAVIGGAALYVYREKKKGAACVGCPYAKECANRNNGCSCGK